MAKFFSPEFFAQLQDALVHDAKWKESVNGLKTSIKLACVSGTERLEYLLKVEDGNTRIASWEPNAQAEFSFEGTYETWTRVAKGEVDLKSAVLKGLMKFKGSITKLVLQEERFVRIGQAMGSVPVEAQQPDERQGP